MLRWPAEKPNASYRSYDHVHACGGKWRRPATCGQGTQRRADHHRRRGLRRHWELRRSRHQDTQHRSSRERRRAAHRLLRERSRLHADAGRPRHGTLPAAGSHGASAGWSTRPRPGPEGHRTFVATAPQDQRLHHCAHRQVAPRLEDRVPRPTHTASTISSDFSVASSTFTRTPPATGSQTFSKTRLPCRNRVI